MKRLCNKLVLRFSFAILLALGATSFASASVQIPKRTQRRLTARVLSVDHKKRTILVREQDGKTMTVVVPKDLKISLSENSPMNRPRLVLLEATFPGMIIDVYVLTVAKVAEAADAASNR